jgi:hypothetical protein
MIVLSATAGAVASAAGVAAFPGAEQAANNRLSMIKVIGNLCFMMVSSRVGYS